MSDAITTLGVASREYERETGLFRQIAIDAAEAEAAHKREAAKFKLRAQAEAGGKTSVAALDMLADADDGIAELYRDRLVKAALWIRLRSVCSSCANGWRRGEPMSLVSVKQTGYTPKDHTRERRR